MLDSIRMQLLSEEPEPQQTKARNARELALSLYPGETWGELEERIFIAESRKPKGKNQEQVLEKELVQARILTSRGSTVYLLPEVSTASSIGVKHPDAVVDGFLMEFKTISGSIHQVEERFKESRKKADRVFIKINADLSRPEVSRKLAGIIAKKDYRGGIINAYFSKSGDFFTWNVDDLGLK
jgi:hypothetical protein